MPRISVIIPTYNHARYLACAVRSILSQMFCDWEAIIVDDGSTDDTAQVVRTFTDARLRYVYQRNQGLSAARNAGLALVHSPLVAFLDADDEWEPEFLSTCLSLFEQKPGLAGVYTRTRYIDGEGLLLPAVGGGVVPAEQLYDRLLEGGFFPPAAALISTQAVVDAGGFDDSLTSVEDWDLWLRVAGQGTMVGIPDALARYRILSGSMSTDVARMHRNRMRVLDKYFGPPSGAPESWPSDKRRAYAFAYRAGALGHIQQQRRDEAWRILAEAVRVWPEMLTRLDTFYELICDDQPRGYRGQAHLLDIEAHGAQVRDCLDRLLAASSELRPLSASAYGNLYLAMAMLSDQAGRWKEARRHLREAVRSNPKLLGKAPVWRRLAKLHLGRNALEAVRHIRDARAIVPRKIP